MFFSNKSDTVWLVCMKRLGLRSAKKEEENDNNHNDSDDVNLIPIHSNEDDEKSNERILEV